MALQRVKTVFDGRWIESSRYIDYHLLDVYVPVSSSFQEFVNCIQRRLFPNLEVSVSRLTVYWKDCNNSNLIQIVNDKDESWIMLVISKFSDNDLLIVVDTVPATDIGSTPYLSSELPRTEDSHSENVIIDLNAFESSHTGISIRVGSMFRKILVLKKAIYMLALNNSFELVTLRSNRTSFDIRCKVSSCPWYLRASGTPEDLYAMLSTFSDALIRNNPGTYTAEEADDEGRFKFYFMALAASIDAWNYCVPIIFVDGAAMKNKYLGNLIYTCTIDENSQIVSLAFAVVDSENDLSWAWFFRNLKAVFGEHNEMNLKKNHKSLPMEDSFNKCYRAYTLLKFEYYMRQLKQLSPSMRHKLEVVGRHRWARAFFRRKRYQIYSVDQHEFEVHHRKEQFVVNILNWTCSRRQWDLDLIPCSHACIALSIRNLNLHLYTDKFYYVSNLINLYKNETHLIGSVNQIRNMHQGGNDGILPLQVKRPA
ncbi:uncharacterized protein E5676_scaffold237G001590 [Cucumis melo var. makuwa]|uniref:Zinc finger PMZ-type domain-containing protein n=1 Tax=Cucumis melo var. makuwa TaxID=1194695 RepID=A0A5D3DAG3_CUCMM|nr:uncharacterized protein E6C27_scaffold36G002340 [Cucumis melo var. makuwa]TYK20567.1 uncharacterized protein E5676_scaffold237G001590 [Cucumis melo var. makuwa]